MTTTLNNEVVETTNFQLTFDVLKIRPTEE